MLTTVIHRDRVLTGGMGCNVIVCLSHSLNNKQY